MRGSASILAASHHILDFYLRELVKRLVLSLGYQFWASSDGLIICKFLCPLNASISFQRIQDQLLGSRILPTLRLTLMRITVHRLRGFFKALNKRTSKSNVAFFRNMDLKPSERERRQELTKRGNRKWFGGKVSLFRTCRPSISN